MYNKIILTFIVLLIISGCAPQIINSDQEMLQKEKSESLMIQAKNYSGLIDLYTSQLSITTLIPEDRDALRFKLASVYYEAGDSEASLFQLRLLPDNSIQTKERYLLQAKAQYKESEFELSQQALDKAFSFDEQYAAAYNFQGILFTEKGEIYDARKSFTIARENSFNDIAVRNNLAMLDILEGDFDSALNILLPILHSGQSDDMVKANLILIYAKLSKFKEFRAMLGKSFSDEEVVERFKLMHDLEIESNKRAEINESKRLNIDADFLKEKLIVGDTITKGVESYSDSFVYDYAPSVSFPSLEETLILPNKMNTRIINKNTEEPGWSVYMKQSDPLESSLVHHVDRISPINSSIKILGINYQLKDNSHNFTISFDQPIMDYNSFDLLAGNQWVVDLKGRFNAPEKSIFVFDSKLVEQSRLSLYPDFARVTFQMKNSTSQPPVLTVNKNTLLVKWNSV